VVGWVDFNIVRCPLVHSRIAAATFPDAYIGPPARRGGPDVFRAGVFPTVLDYLESNLSAEFVFGIARC